MKRSDLKPAKPPKASIDPGSDVRGGGNGSKAFVLAVMVLTALSLGGLGGFLTRRHWEWLDTNRFAGLAILEVFFWVVSALGAIGLTLREWQGQTPAEVARDYLLAFGAMLTVFLAVGVLIFIAAWAWALVNGVAYWNFHRHPWKILGGLAGVFLLRYWWVRRQARS